MILVTGATGILGRVIVLELLKQGLKVRATKRSASNLDEVKHSYSFYTHAAEDYFKQIEWVNVDFEDQYSLEKVLVGVDEIYHCAAKVSFNPNDEKEMYQTNIEGTKNLLYACQGLPIKKFCHISSIAVLDGMNEDGIQDEDSDFNSKLNHSSYAVSKHWSEMEVWRASAEGLNTVILNPGMIIGSGNWEESSGEIFNIAEDNSFTFSGGTSYVDVRDVAKIAVELMNKNMFGERFVIISENIRYKAFTDRVRKKLGLKESKILSKSILNIGNAFNILLGWAVPKLRMLNTTNIEAVTTFTDVSNKKIKSRLNYHFIPVTESIDFHLDNYIKDKKSIR